MMAAVTSEQVTELAALLPPIERLRLVERIIHDLAASHAPDIAPRRRWGEIRGRPASSMLGEDAQDWVSRTRRESDERRES